MMMMMRGVVVVVVGRRRRRRCYLRVTSVLSFLVSLVSRLSSLVSSLSSLVSRLSSLVSRVLSTLVSLAFYACCAIPDLISMQAWFTAIVLTEPKDNPDGTKTVPPSSMSANA
eukprot:1448606-Rhodomonas_salina.5